VGGSDRTRRLVDGLGLFSLGLGTTQLVAPDAVNRLVGVEDSERSRAVQRWFGGAREVATGAGIESRRRPGLWLWARVAGLENLPRFMAHLESVESLGGGRSRWRAAGPARVQVAWDAEISDERIDEFIAWRSVPDAKVTNWGEVEFRPAPGRGEPRSASG
jgi:uncharacterized membrane protein